MPSMAPSGSSTPHFFKPQQALSSASPSVGPPTKRPRLRSTPSSSISATPSTSNESTSSADVNSARRASTLRVLNVWAQLAERYSKRLDEDDIIDLYSGAIIKDRGVVRGSSRDYHFGHIAQPDDDQDFPDADQEDSEQDEDENENVAPSDTTDDDAPISKKELLRGVPPLSTTTDAEDLKEFMEAEKERRALAGEEEEEDISPEELSALRKVLEERERAVEAAVAKVAQAATSAEPSREPEVGTTPTCRPARVPPSDDESEDELAVWTHDESTAVYPVVQNESEQEVHEVEREVIELTDSDSDREFEAILTLPSYSARVSPLPVPRPEKVRQPSPDRRRKRSKSCSRIKLAEGTRKSQSRGCSPLSLKPEITIAHKIRSSVLRERDFEVSDSEKSDREVVHRARPASKGKGKEVPPVIEDNHREEVPKSPVTSRGRKRKRIVSSPADDPLTRASEPKNRLQSHEKSKPQSSVALAKGPTPTLDEGVTTPTRPVAGPSHSLPPFSASKARVPRSAFRSIEPESDPPILPSNVTLLSDSLTPVAHPYPQRQPSHPPPIISSSKQGTPGFPVHPPPPLPLDPIQAQQAHLLLAQAMQQLSYILSATIPYSPYASDPEQSWNHPADDAYSSPIHYPLYLQNARPYPTPSSSVPLSSPVQTSIPPPLEEQRQRARSRGRSKSRGRRVSFKLDGEPAIEDNIDSEPVLQHGGQKTRKLSFELQPEKGKGKVMEELEDRINPPPETRGRTPGPPNRRKNGRTTGQVARPEVA